LRDLSAKQIDAWLVELYRTGDIAPATINKLLQTLRTILERAVIDGWLEENPADQAAASVYVRPFNCSLVAKRSNGEDTPRHFSAFRISCRATMSAFTPGLLGPVETKESPWRV
jgi:hypothetical protein